MRLATWNCCGGPLDRKLAAAEAIGADLLVLPESPALPTTGPTTAWVGDTPRKGLAVLARHGLTLRPVRRRTPLPRFVLPLMVDAPEPFLLLAVWMKGLGPDRYVRGLHRAIHACRRLIRSRPTVLLGDLNSNAIWDHEHPGHLNHSALVGSLGTLGLVSAYHHARGEPHGQESAATFYLHRRRQALYHLDYCFLPQGWLPRLAGVQVGRWLDWHALSDHVPVIVDLHPPR